MDAKLIRIPRTFYDDHWSRELPSPMVVKNTQRHYWIYADDPAISELLSDARHYASDQGWEPHLRALCASARATVKALTAR